MGSHAELQGLKDRKNWFRMIILVNNNEFVGLNDTDAPSGEEVSTQHEQRYMSFITFLLI